MQFRLIDTGYNNPYMNMAIDEALLSSKLPVLRFYGWKPAGLSIGYFQSIKNFNFKNLKKYKIDLVRRLTGGNAILHDKEVTYSLIIDEEKMPKGIIESYKQISKGLLEGLRNLGLKADMNKDVEKGEKSAVCFNDPSWYEILVNNKKIIGSAQKRANNKLLQHGAILIDIDVERYCSLFNNCDEKLVNKVKKRMTSINDELRKKSHHGWPTGVAPYGASARASSKARSPTALGGGIFSEKVNYKKVKQAMVKGFGKELNIDFEKSELTKEEINLAKKLEKNKYSTYKWNCIR